MSCFDVEKIENCYAHSQTYADGAEIRGALGDDRMKASFPDDRVDESKRFFEDALAAILAARETE